MSAHKIPVPDDSAFTTGASTGEAEAPAAAPALALHSYRLSGDTENCKPFDPCGELVEVDLDGPALTAGEPFWFRLSAPLPDRTESLTIGFIPGSDGPPARAMVAIDPEGNIAGAISGSVTRRNTRAGEARRFIAASSSVRSNKTKLAVRVRTT